MSTYDELIQRSQSGEFTRDLPDAQPPVAQKPEPLQQDQGFWDSSIGDVLAAIPRGVVGAAKSAYGLADTLALDILPDWKVNPLGESKTIVGGLIQGVADFATGFWALGGVTGIVGKSFKGAEFLIDVEKSAAASIKAGRSVTELSTAGRVIAGAATDFTAFDGQSGRLADLVATIPGLEQPMHEYMNFALTNEQDGEVLGRIKNTLEGAGIGAAMDGLIKGFQWMRKINEEKAAGKTFPEAKAAADKSVGSIEDIAKIQMRADDFLFPQESPFKADSALLDEAILRADTELVQVLPDASPAPVGRGERKLQLASREAHQSEVDSSIKAVVEENGFEFGIIDDLTAKAETTFNQAKLKLSENIPGVPDGGLEQIGPDKMKTVPWDTGVFLLVDGKWGKDGSHDYAVYRRRDNGRLYASKGLVEVAGAEKVGKLMSALEPHLAQVHDPVSTFYPLTLKQFPTLVKKDLVNWVNQHGTLLSNPHTVIQLENGKATIGLNLRPDQLDNSEVQAILKSMRETPDMTPGELGAAAQDINRLTAPGLKTASQGASMPRGMPAPAGDIPHPSDLPGPKGVGVQKNLSEAGQTPHSIYLTKMGIPGKTQVELSKIMHGEFVLGAVERGKQLLKFQAFSHARQIGPALATDAINPRDFSHVELFQMGLKSSSINLSEMRGLPDADASLMRVVSDMARAAIEADMPKIKGVKFAEMQADAYFEMAKILAIPNAMDRATYIARKGRSLSEAVDEATAFATSVKALSIGHTQELRKLSDELTAKEAKVPGSVTDREWAEYAERADHASRNSAQFQAIANAQGRGLVARKAPLEAVSDFGVSTATLQADPEAVRQGLLDHGGRDAIRDAARKMSLIGGDSIDDVAARLKLADGGGKKYIRITQEYWMGALLSSIKTHTAQTISNLFGATFLPFERAVAAGIGQHFAKNPQDVLRLRSEFGAAIGTYTSMWTSLGESFQVAKMAFKGNDNILSPSSSVFDVSRRANGSSLTAANLGATGAAGSLVDVFGKVMSIPMRTLRASDEMFKNLAYRGVARARLIQEAADLGLTGAQHAQHVEQAMDMLVYKGQALSVDQLRRKAVDQVQAEGLTGIDAVETAERRVQSWVKAPEYEKLSKLAQFALGQAEEGTYSKKLDSASFAGKYQKFVNEQPVLKFATPFVKTPVNLALFGLQRLDFVHAGQWLYQTKMLGKDGSAFAASRNRLLRDFADADPIVRANAQGRLIMGSSFAAGVAMLAGADLLTGRGPSDPDQRRALSDAGWMPYSVKVGDTYVSYSRMDPMATILGTIADVSLATRYAPEDKQHDLGEIGMGVVAALANNFTNKSYLQGVANFVDLLKDPKKEGANTVRSFVSSFVPNLSRDVANLGSDLAVGDETQKEIRTTLDAIMSKILGLSEILEPQRNAFGEKIRRFTPMGQDTLGAVAAFANPITTRTAKDALLTEMSSLNYGFSRPPSSRNGYDMVDIKTRGGQSAYDRWLENSGEIKINGKTMRQALETLVQSDQYQSLSNYNLSDQQSPRIGAVKQVIDRYRRNAFNKTLSESPDLSFAERTFQARKAMARAGIQLR